MSLMENVRSVSPRPLEHDPISATHAFGERLDGVLHLCVIEGAHVEVEIFEILRALLGELGH